jgi:hypothetical protein
MQTQYTASIDHTTGIGKAEVETITTYDNGTQQVTLVDYNFTTYDKKGNDNSQQVQKGTNVDTKA